MLPLPPPHAHTITTASMRAATAPESALAPPALAPAPPATSAIAVAGEAALDLVRVHLGLSQLARSCDKWQQHHTLARGCMEAALSTRAHGMSWPTCPPARPHACPHVRLPTGPPAHRPTC